MKKCLRKELKQVRAQKNKIEVLTQSNLITNHIVTLLQITKPCIVALYYPYSGEPNLLSLIPQLKLRKFKWAFPVCSSDQNLEILRFAHFEGFDSFVEGQYGIPIPNNTNWVQPDWVLIPCLAVNLDGFRLGYGAGWYDRTLSHLTQIGQKPTTVGIAWQEAVVEEKFQEPHDQPLDYLVTPYTMQKLNSL